MSSQPDKLAELEAQLKVLQIQNLELKIQAEKDKNQQLLTAQAQAAAAKNQATGKETENKVLDEKQRRERQREMMIANLTVSYVDMQPSHEKRKALVAMRKEVDEYLAKPGLYTHGGGLRALVYQAASKAEATLYPKPPVQIKEEAPLTDAQRARLEKRAAANKANKK